MGFITARMTREIIVRGNDWRISTMGGVVGVEVSLDNVQDCIRDLDKLENVIDSYGDKTVREIARILQNQIRMEIRKSQAGSIWKGTYESRRKRGPMASLVRVTPGRSERYNKTMFVECTAPYAKYQDLGTDDHDPKYARAMKFGVPGEDEPILRTKVKGVQAKHFMSKSLRKVKTKLREVLKREWGDARKAARLKTITSIK